MFNRFCLLALTAVVLATFALTAFIFFLNERSSPTPQNRPDESTQTTPNRPDESTQTNQTRPDESTQTTQNRPDESTQTNQTNAAALPPSLDAPPKRRLSESFARSRAPSFAALRRRQEKAERYAAQNNLDAAVQEADYVASQIRIFGLNRAVAADDEQDAQKFASLLEAALATLEECSRQAEGGRADVSPSEPTSLRL